MADVFHDWGQDLQTTATGDLLSVDSTQRSEQRIIRRLMTIEEDYIFHPEYGGSVPLQIGRAVDPLLIQGICHGQMLLEDTVSRLQVPSVDVEGRPDGTLFTLIKYVESETNQQLELSFEVT